MKNIILLPRIVEDLQAIYTENNEVFSDLPTTLKRDFCPKKRGLLYREEGSKIKIWSEKIALICIDASEKDSLKVVAIKGVKDYQYQFALERGNILAGDWSFIMPNEAHHLPKKSSHTNEVSMEFIEEELRENNEDSFSIDEGVAFEKYVAYWENHDIVKKYQEEALFEQKAKSVGQFTKITIDFDEELIKLHLKKDAPNYRVDEHIVITSNENWKKYYQLENEHLKSLRGFNLGRVRKYNKNDKWLVIHSKTSIIQRLIKEKTLQVGYLWADDIGSKSKLRRESEALKTLFRGESTNKNLKNFMPEIASIKHPIVHEQVNFNLLSDEFVKFKDKQKEAVLGALNCNDIYLIQGPPGTGKTTVISEIIRYLVNDNKKILLSSQTNLAVDNVLQRIGQKENVRAIRIGPEEKFELDSIQYSLENRVEDLQKKMTKTLNERPIHFKILKETLESNVVLVDAHHYVRKEIKVIINMKQNQATYEEKLVQIKSNLQRLQNHLFKMKQDEQQQMKEIGENVFVVEKLRAIQENSLNTLQQNTISAELTDKLNLSKEEAEYINNYKSLVDEIKCILSEVNELQQDRESTIEHMEQIVDDMQYTNTRIVSLEEQNVGLSEQMQTYLLRDIQNFKQLIDEMKMDLHEQKYQLSKLDEKIAELKKKALNLRSLALNIKEMIEQLIEQNRDVWIAYFQAPTITKEEFINLCSRIDSFKAEFSSVLQEVHLLSKLDRFDQISSLKNDLAEMKQEMDMVEKEQAKNQKFVSKFKEKLLAYEENELLQLYMSHYKMQFSQLVIEQEIARVESFISIYELNTEELALYESTLDLQGEWNQKLQYYQESFEDIYINTSNLICATCLGIAATSNNHFLNTEFDYVILDEAARASSMELLIPLIRGKKIVLVGDHKQISPTLEKDILDKLERDDVVNTTEIQNIYKKSLFGLMYDDAHDQMKTFLNMQFRMNPDISHSVSKYYYDGKLLDGENVYGKKHSLENILPKAFYWMDTPNTPYFTEKKEHTSFYNEGEIQTINAVLQWLNTKLDFRKSVGIISPYKAQMNKLLELVDVDQYPMLDIEINTVDAFQGREKNIVINSLVRNNTSGTVGHVRQESRMNVALSRAQELSIYIGNVDFIRRNKSKVYKINQMITDLQNRNTVLHANDFLKDGDTLWN